MSNLCHENGTLSKLLPDNNAEVVVMRAEACGSCAAKGSCQSLGGMKDKVILTVSNPINASPGDTVRISISESAIIKASAVLYLIPAFCLVAGAIVGNRIAVAQQMSEDPYSLAGAVGGFCLGMFLSWLIGKQMSRRKSVTPALTAIVEKSQK